MRIIVRLLSGGCLVVRLVNSSKKQISESWMMVVCLMGFVVSMNGGWCSKI